MAKDEVRKVKRTLEISDMIRMYTEGESTTVIAQLANVTPRYVQKVLSDHRVPKRPHGSWKRKYTVDEDYFKKWSNNMAYILGFFTADGTVAPELQSISFAQKEKYILEDIKKEMASNHPIYQDKKTGVHILHLHSKVLKADVMDIHGIKPNKSRDILFPDVPEEYMSHFIRGYFDGDGFVNYPKYFVSFVGGSHLFMKSLQEVLENNGFITNFTDHESYFRVYVSGRKTIKKFADWIYHNKGLFLKRKYDAFNQETQDISNLKDKRLKYNKNAVQQRKNRFLDELKEHKDVETAIRNIGITEQTINSWMKTDELFKSQFQIIINDYKKD